MQWLPRTTIKPYASYFRLPVLRLRNHMKKKQEGAEIPDTLVRCAPLGSSRGLKMNWSSSDSWEPAVRCIFTGKLRRVRNKLALVRFFSQDTLLWCAPLGISRVLRLGRGLFTESDEGSLNLTRVHWISRGFTESHEGLNISRVGFVVISRGEN